MRKLAKKSLAALIARLERFLHTDISYLLQGSFWSVVGRVTSSLVAFLLSILYARYLPKDLYGTYRYVMSLMGTFALFSLSDIGTAITRSVARGYEGTALRGMKIIFLSSLGITVASLIASAFFFARGSSELALSFLTAAFLAPLVEGLGSWRAYLDGKKDFKRKALYNFTEQAFYAAAAAGAVFAITTGNLGIIAGTALLVGAFYVGNAIPNIVYSLRIRAQAMRSQAMEEEGALRYGLHLSAVKIPATIANYIDSILLFHYLGAAHLAIYSFALAPTEQIKTLLTNVANVSFPKFSEKTASEENRLALRKTLPLKIAKTSIISALMVAAYIAVAPVFFRIFFPHYLDSVTYSQALSLSLILFPLGVFGSALKAEANLKSIYIYETAAPIIQIIAFFSLIPAYGLWGAVAGKIIGRLATHILVSFLYVKQI